MDFLPVVALGFFEAHSCRGFRMKAKVGFFSVLKTRCCNHSHLIVQIFSK